MRALRPQLPQKPHLKPEWRKALQFLARSLRGAMEDDSWLLGRLITCFVGVAVAFAVARQSYEDIARQIVATSYVQFSSIMQPRTAPARINFGTARLGGTPATLEPSMFELQELDSAVAAPNMEAPFRAPYETIAAKGEVTGRPERVNEPAAWERAQHIARDALDGNIWLNEVGKATHYRARWVHPRWVRKMRRLDRIGMHTFYRPRNWGDGSN